MKNLKITTLNDKQAQVTKAFQKQAVIFGTEEYKLWREYKKDFPEAQMVVKKIKRNSEKETYKNMTYANMITYIECQPNADQLLAEFDRQKKLASIYKNPYQHVREWFIKELGKQDEYFANLSNNQVVDPKATQTSEQLYA